MSEPFSPSGKTALLYGCRNGKLNLVQWLVKTIKANAHAVDTDGSSAMYAAGSLGGLNTAIRSGQKGTCRRKLCPVRTEERRCTVPAGLRI